jgi:MoaA/NifB/PqqE/SkfB family radical SAM enzyme
VEYLTREEIAAWPPDAPLAPGDTELERARRNMRSLGLAGNRQQMGLRWGVVCVALEITQRCNLDCTLCYLSDHSEAVHDLPMEEIHRRIDAIFARYGANTDVQITGGDPTLRRRDELLEIVARIRALGMRPTLMTNGIRADRKLLLDLARHGLVDVAFHVDTTQERRGYGSERSLEPLRDRYIELARQAGLSIMFNTTIHAGNLEEIPYLVSYFRQRADDVRTVAFQLQAETGRGVLGERDRRITIDNVIARIEAGAGTRISFESMGVGHTDCSRYALCLAVGDELHDLFDDEDFVARLLPATADLVMHRDHPLRTALSFARWLIAHPRHLAACLPWAARKAWRERRLLIASRGRVSTLSFTLHNFMDSCRLERERICACAFKLMTVDGPVSMCLHNAKRDAYILKPVPIGTASEQGFWQPLTGCTSATVAPPERLDAGAHPLKRLKGRARKRTLLARRQACASHQGASPRPA